MESYEFAEILEEGDAAFHMGDKPTDGVPPLTARQAGILSGILKGTVLEPDESVEDSLVGRLDSHDTIGVASETKVV